MHATSLCIHLLMHTWVAFISTGKARGTPGFPSSFLSFLLSTYFFLLFLRKNKLNAELLVRIEQQEKHGSCRPATAGYQRGHNPEKNRQPWASHQGPASEFLMKKHFLENPNGHCFTNHKTHKSNKSFHLVTLISTSHLKILRIN